MLPQECVECLRYAPAAPGRLGKCTTENAEGHGGIPLWPSIPHLLWRDLNDSDIFEKKKQAAQGEALSGLVGEVLRGGG
jgi:hypothetical protein